MTENLATLENDINQAKKIFGAVEAAGKAITILKTQKATQADLQRGIDDLVKERDGLNDEIAEGKKTLAAQKAQGSKYTADGKKSGEKLITLAREQAVEITAKAKVQLKAVNKKIKAANIKQAGAIKSLFVAEKDLNAIVKKTEDAKADLAKFIEGKSS